MGTCRDASKAAESAGRLSAQLAGEGISGAAVDFKVLDLDSDPSVQGFVEWLQGSAHWGRIAAFVNNAVRATLQQTRRPVLQCTGGPQMTAPPPQAIQIEAGNDPPPFGEQAAPTLRTNFTQACVLTKAMLPGLAPNSGRVVLVSSMAGPAAYADCTPPSPPPARCQKSREVKS